MNQEINPKKKYWRNRSNTFLSLARLHLFRCSYVQTARTKLFQKKFRPMNKEINKLL